MFLTKWLVSGTLVLSWVEAFSENSVLLKSPDGYLNKLVTSSTLRWVTAQGGSRPETAVVATTERYINESSKGSGEDNIFEREVYVCRASHSGLWIPGQLRPERKACIFSLHENINSYESYEVLENIEGGGRLTWVRWDKFKDVPSGAVSSGESFVARRAIRTDADKSPGIKHIIGKLDDSDFAKLHVITEEEKEEEVEDGEVLVEIEPIRYELTNIKFNNAKKFLNKSPVVLGEAILTNKQDTSSRVDTIIGYDDNTTVSWGHVKAMLKGLPTIIRGSPESTYPDEIEWGIPQREFTKRIKMIDTVLEPETAVNVTLKGNHTEIETPYTARLIAVYMDGGNRARQIHGIRFEVQLLDVTAIYSPVYFTGNYSLVPTTTTTTSTTTPTSTTRKSTTEKTTEHTTQPIKEIDSNSIDTKEDESKVRINIMNDEGSKSQEKSSSSEPNKASINSIQLHLCLMLAATLILRIW